MSILLIIGVWDGLGNITFGNKLIQILEKLNLPFEHVYYYTKTDKEYLDNNETKPDIIKYTYKVADIFNSFDELINSKYLIKNKYKLYIGSTARYSDMTSMIKNVTDNRNIYLLSEYGYSLPFYQHDPTCSMICKCYDVKYPVKLNNIYTGLNNNGIFFNNFSDLQNKDEYCNQIDKYSDKYEIFTCYYRREIGYIHKFFKLVSKIETKKPKLIFCTSNAPKLEDSELVEENENDKIYSFDGTLFINRKLSHDNFIYLMLKSHKIVGITGNLSLSEALSLYKVPIFECSEFLTRLLCDTKNFLLDNNYSNLYKFCFQNILNEYQEYDRDVKKEYKNFIKFVINNKNLSEYLERLIMECAYKRKIYKIRSKYGNSDSDNWRKREIIPKGGTNQTSVKIMIIILIVLLTVLMVSSLMLNLINIINYESGNKKIKNKK